MVLNYGNCVLLNKVMATELQDFLSLSLPPSYPSVTSCQLGRQTLFSESHVVTSSGDLFFFAEQLVLRFSLKLLPDETDPADQETG